MFESVRSMLRRYDLISPGDRITCAVSGGADSMALLWCMYLLKDSLGIDLRAAHFNHGLRGAESDEDAAFVERFCRQFDIPLTVGRGEVKAGPKGLEAAARDARYGFFATLEGKIATAHTADDNAETVLMHMVRGTGLKGLGGISPQRGNVIRPMLMTTRSQVLTFLREYHIDFREDSSNSTDAFLRNRLRHGVMPLLRQENPRFAEKVSQMAMGLRQDEQALAYRADFSEGLLLNELEQLPEGLQNRLIADFLRHIGVKEPDFDHIALVRALAGSQKPSARGQLPGGITVARCYDRLVKLEQTQAPEPVSLSCPGQVTFGGFLVSCVPASPGDPGAVCYEGPVAVRSRQAGDTIRLSGGTKSLKKLYIDRKIPAARRQCLPVVADEKGVLAAATIGYNRERLEGETAMIITFQ